MRVATAAIVGCLWTCCLTRGSELESLGGTLGEIQAQGDLVSGGESPMAPSGVILGLDENRLSSRRFWPACSVEETYRETEPRFVKLTATVPSTCLEPIGILVTSIGPETLKSGTLVKVGDILVGWSRRPLLGLSPQLFRLHLRSFSDWVELFEEHAPQGPLTVMLIRDDSLVETTLEPEDWEFEILPGLSWQSRNRFQAAKRCVIEARKDSSEAKECLMGFLDAIPLQDPSGEYLWASLQLVKESSLQSGLDSVIEFIGKAVGRSTDTMYKARLLKARAKLLVNLKRSEEAYQDLLFSYQLMNSGQTLEGARTAIELGEFLANSGKWREAAEWFSLSVKARTELAPMSLIQAEALMDFGASMRKLAKFPEARDSLSRASYLFSICDPVGDKFALNESFLGELSESIGEWDKAEQYYSNALGISESLNPRSSEVAGSLVSRAGIMLTKGRFKEAKEDLLRAFDIAKEGRENRAVLARCVNSLGDLSLSEGLWDKAGYYMGWAYDLDIGLDPWSTDSAVVSSNMGTMAFYRNDRKMAREWVDRSNKILAKVDGGENILAANYNVLGSVEQWEGNHLLSAEYFRKALDLLEEHMPGSDLMVTTRFNYISALVRLGRYDAAEELLDSGIKSIRSGMGSPRELAEFLKAAAVVALQKQDYGQCSLMIAEALQILREISKGTRDLSHALQIAGELAFALGERGKASILFRESMDAIDVEVGNLGGSYESRAASKERSSLYYAEAVSAFLKLQDIGAAFGTLERFRSTMFLNLVADRDLKLEEGSPDLLARKIVIAQELEAATRRLATVSNMNSASPLIEKLQLDIRDLQVRTGNVAALSRSGKALLSDARYPASLNSDAWTEVLEEGTLLLSYSVIGERVDLFVGTLGSGIRYFEIEGDAWELRRMVLEMRSVITQVAEEKNSFGGLRSKQLDEISLGLFSRLLGPVTDLILESERILIIPDSFLNYLPFSALRIPHSVSLDARYLVELRPVFFTMSTTLYANRELLYGAPRPRGVGRKLKVAAFGDPIYGEFQEPKRGEIESFSEGFQQVRSANERGLLDWKRLPFSRVEVEGIYRVTKDDTEIFVGEAASEENFRRLQGPFDVVHIAAHASIDEDFPLSSFVALAAGGSPEDSRSNGLLQAWEILEQIRLNADLVVLSACQTGLGKSFKGDGLIGLTRAFQYAGARSVMASLWEIADDTTSAFMISFYRHFQAGLSKSEALRAAQIEFIDGRVSVLQPDGSSREIDASSPYYWAAFQLYGDWQ